MANLSISMFSNAQIGLIPQTRINEICIALNVNICNAEQAMFKLLRWGQMEIQYYKTNGQREPLLKMMDTLRQRSSCLACCLNPNDHFYREICCPIGIFYDSIRDLCPVAAQIFSKPEVQQEVLQAVNHLLFPRYAPTRHPSGLSAATSHSSSSSDQISLSSVINHYPAENDFPSVSRFICFHPTEKPNVLLFENIESHEFNKEMTSVMINLLKTLDDKFTLCSVPQLQDSSEETFNAWQKFFCDQIKTSADCMIILLTHSFLSFQDRLGNTDLSASPLRRFDKRILSVWTKFKQHNNVTGAPIIIVALSKDVYIRGRELFPQVFKIPKETKKLLKKIKRCTR